MIEHNQKNILKHNTLFQTNLLKKVSELDDKINEILKRVEKIEQKEKTEDSSTD